MVLGPPQRDQVAVDVEPDDMSPPRNGALLSAVCGQLSVTAAWDLPLGDPREKATVVTDGGRPAVGQLGAHVSRTTVTTDCQPR